MLKQLMNLTTKPNFKSAQTPSHQFDCDCYLCQTYQHKKILEFKKIRNFQLNSRLEEKLKQPKNQNNSNFLWIIKKLQLPTNKIISRGLEIFIPQICFYQDGEPFSFFMNKQINDPNIKQLNKEKLQLNSFILKSFDDRRKKYRQLIASLINPPLKQRIKKPSYLIKDKNKNDKDAIIVKYNDGSENLLKENQFFDLMSTRKQDPIWQKIYYLKNFIIIPEQSKNMIVIKYQQNRNIILNYYQRAFTLMKIYAKVIEFGQKNYISQQNQQKFSSKLQELNLNQYFTYLSYKIVQFVQYFHDVKIKKAHFHWAIDQLKRPILLNLYRLQFQQLFKYDWTNQIIQSRIKQQEQKVFYTKQINEINKTMDLNSKTIQSTMEEQYDNIKERLGFSKKIRQNIQEIRNNQFFKKMHPECPVDISTVFLNKELTITEFKSKFLGIKNTKRPLVTQFKSDMVKILHSLNPVSRKSSNREYLSEIQRDKKYQSLENHLKIKYNTNRNNSTRASASRATVHKLEQLNKTLDK